MNTCIGLSKMWFLGLLLVTFVAGCGSNDTLDLNAAKVITAQMKMQLSKLSVVEDYNSGCLDAHLLNLTFYGHQQSALVYQSNWIKFKSANAAKG